MTQPKEDTALGLARTRFIEALPQKAAELHASIARVRETNEDEPSRDELRRRFHALYASSQVFRIEPLARSLKSCLDAIDEARAEKRSIAESELRKFASILDAIPELAAGERASLVPEVSSDDAQGSQKAYSPPSPGEMARAPKSAAGVGNRSMSRPSLPAIERRPSMSFRPRARSSPSNIAAGREFTSRRAAETLRCDRVLVLMMIGGEPITQRILPVFPANRVEVIQCANEREAVEHARAEQPDTIAIAPSYAKSARRALAEAGLEFIPRVQLSPAGASEEDYGGFGAFGVVAVNAPPVKIAQLIIDAASGPSESALTRTLEAPETAPQLPELGEHEIVIAFDAPGITQFMANELKALGLTVHRASDAARAIELTRTIRPSLVLASAGRDEERIERAIFGDPSLLRTRLCFVDIPEALRERMMRLPSDDAEAIEAGRYGVAALIIELLALMSERARRLQAAEACRGRLRGTGNVELLEALKGSEGPLRLEVRDAERYLEIELLDGAVKAARFTSSSGDFLRGDRALDRLPRFLSGRFRLMPSSETEYKGPTIADGTIERLSGLALRASATLQVLGEPGVDRALPIALNETIVRETILDEERAAKVLGAGTLGELKAAFGEEDRLLELIAAAAFTHLGAPDDDEIAKAISTRDAAGSATPEESAADHKPAPRRRAPSAPAIPVPPPVRTRKSSSGNIPIPPPLRREGSVGGVPMPRPHGAASPAQKASEQASQQASGQAKTPAAPPIATAPPLPPRRESSVAGVPLPKPPPRGQRDGHGLAPLPPLESAAAVGVEKQREKKVDSLFPPSPPVAAAEPSDEMNVQEASVPDTTVEVAANDPFVGASPAAPAESEAEPAEASAPAPEASEEPESSPLLVEELSIESPATEEIAESAEPSTESEPSPREEEATAAPSAPLASSAASGPLKTQAPAPSPPEKRSSREWIFGIAAAAVVFALGFVAIEMIDLGALMSGEAEETSAAEKAREAERATAEARAAAEPVEPADPPLPSFEPLYGRSTEGVSGGVTKDEGLLIIEIGRSSELPTNIRAGGASLDLSEPQKALSPGRHEIVIERGSETIYRYIFIEAGKTRTLNVP